MFVFLYYTKSVPTQDKLHIIRLPNVPCFICVLVFMLFYSTKSVPIRDQLHREGSQRTRCSTSVYVLFVYLCAGVPLLRQKCIQDHQERSNSGPVTQRRISTNQMFHLCIYVVCVFVCRCSFTPTKVYTGSGSQQTKFPPLYVCCVCVSIIHQKCFNSGQVTQNQAPNEPNVPPLYVCCVLL